MNRSLITIITFLLLLPAVSLMADGNEVLGLRKLYYRAASEERAARELYDICYPRSDSDVIRMGYMAAAEFLLCKHAFNPYTKLKYFNKGKAHLSRAIANAPDNMELRALRYAVQTNVPALLNYQSDIETDRQALLLYLENNNTNDADLRERISRLLGQ